MLRRPPRSTLFPYTTPSDLSTGACAPGTPSACDDGDPCNGVETCDPATGGSPPSRSEEHTSELQSQSNLVCRLLLEKKKKRHSRAARSFASTRSARPASPKN